MLNDELVVDGIANSRIAIETEKGNYKLDFSYQAGDLILTREAFDVLKSDSIKSATLMFDVYFYRKKNYELLNIKTSFSKFLMQQPYVILNIYDLRDKKNKRQLGYLTKDDYICETVFPNGGRFLRHR